MKKVFSLIISIAVLASSINIAWIPAQAASTAESSFFGELNYSEYEGLSAVKAAADKNDYATAKKELLKYYKDRRSKKQLAFDITSADENYGMAVLPMRNILTGPYEFDMWQGEFTVTDSAYKDYETDVTERIAAELANGAVSFMLFAGDKQQYAVNVKSKETDFAPKLAIVYDDGTGEKTAQITASADTYISSQNTSATYGSAQILPVKEDGTGSSSTGTNTTRAYMTFPLDTVKNSAIVSAKLIVNAAYDSSCTTDKDVLVINVGDTIWDENSLTWSGTRGSIYSYQNAGNPTWKADAPNADSEYHNVTSRFWFGRPMAYEYLSYLEDPAAYNSSHPYSDIYMGDQFGPKLVSLMSAFSKQMNYGWTRTLETGERLNRWVDIVDAFLATDVFDGREDDFYNIITFMYGDCKYLNGLDIASDTPWWSNWRIVANAGFFKACEYLPELNMHDNFRSKAEYNVEYTMDLLYNDDMSFSEAGPSYAQWCAELFGDCARMAEKAGNPMSNDFKTKLAYAARYAMDSFYPDGFDSNVGDSNYRDKLPSFKKLAEFLDDPVLTAYTEGDDTYTERLGAVYPEANSAFMRTGWNPRENTYVSFVNNPSDGHYHPDSNSVLMYAYGQPLLVDSGRYSYSSTNSIYNTLRTAQAHNTIEADGVNMDKHSVSAGKMNIIADNGLFTLASSSQKGYSGINHTRNVLFFKQDGFATLVTDYLTGASSKTYRQNWHFMPSSNAAVNGHTVTTDFYGKANVSVANADSGAAAAVKDGYFSADYGLVANSKYASFEKTGTEVKFSTVLKPSKAGAREEITASDLSAENSACAVSVTDGMSFYLANTDSAAGVFGNYVTDAKAAFADENGALVYGLANGSTLTKNSAEYIKAPSAITSVGVVSDNGNVSIYGEDLKPDNSKATAIKLYAPNAVSVTLNGETVEFTQDGDYIYAVGVVGGDEVIGEIVADKDGFVKDDGTNEGASSDKPENANFIQAALSGWAARNAYAAFDIASAADNFDKAVLKMKITEQVSGQNIHFYWLGYGDWTRANLPFVLDSAKMPTNKKASTSSYTGFGNHFSGSVAGLAAGDTLEVDITSALKGYLSGGGDKKFTLAMLSENSSDSVNRSVKFASINTDNGPCIVFTKNGETADEPITVKVSFADNEGNEVKSAEEITDGLKRGYLYTYNAPTELEKDGKKYILDKTNSRLAAVIESGENTLAAVYKEKEALPIIGENLITNGSFTNGCADWTNAADGGAFDGTVSDNATYIHGSGKALTNKVSAGGSAVSTLRRYIPVESGKTYYLSFWVYNTGAQTKINEHMSAYVPVKVTDKSKMFGSFDGIIFKDFVAYGGQNSWSKEKQSEVSRDRADIQYSPGMNHMEYLITVPNDSEYIMMEMFAWVNGGRLYFSDFELYETDDNVPVKRENVIKLNPADASPFNNGEFQGWGTSLCWWANRIGADENMTEQAAKLFFSDEGLSLDIARFNIGGGDDPTHTHITRSDSNMPGYATGFDNDGNIVYDWSADSNQRNMTLAALKANPDLYIAGFSNSPPYFMTNSGCSSGAADASKNNLKDDQYENFAKYLANVTKYLKENDGINIQCMDPMNEPDTNYWGANSNKQEGCHFDPGTSQSNILIETRKALDEAGLSKVSVVGTDETDINKAVTNFGKLSSQAQNSIDRIDTHTYSGSQRGQLKQTAVSADKNLWMSEVDGNWDMLSIADRIITDMNGMQPSAWIIWNIVDRHRDANSDAYMIGSSGTYYEKNMPFDPDGAMWGVGLGNWDSGKIELMQKYYAFGQFTRYIQPGMTIIGSSPGSLAAYDKKTGEIVIVALNQESADKEVFFDLRAFTRTGNTAQPIRTSGTFANGEQWAELDPIEVENKEFKATLKARSITTYIISDAEKSDVEMTDFNATNEGMSYKYITSGAMKNYDKYFAVYNADSTLKALIKNESRGAVTGDFSGCSFKLMIWNNMEPVHSAVTAVKGTAPVEPIGYMIINGPTSVIADASTVYDYSVTLSSPDTVTWTVSDTEIAQITADGKLTAKKGGSFTLTATTQNGKSTNIDIISIGLKK